MGTFGEYSEAATLDHWFGTTGAHSAPGTLYFGVSYVAVSASGGEYVGQEPSSDTGYTRVSVTNTSSNFLAAATSTTMVKYNAVAITFPAVTCSSWGTVSYAFVCDTSSMADAGNMLAWGALTVNKDLDVGDTASFAANSFKITLT